MKTKKLLMYLECINENLNTLILNQEMTYFIMREILKKMDRSVNKRHVKVSTKPCLLQVFYHFSNGSGFSHGKWLSW